MIDKDLQLESYDYDLPQSLIAQVPAQPVHSAKLLICQENGIGGYSYTQTTFLNLLEHLDSKYLMFFNRTKVFKARIPLSGVKIIKKNGSEVSLDKGEIFVYSLLGKDQFECLVSDGKHFKPGSKIIIDEKVSFLSLAFTENGIAFQIKGMDLLDFLEQYGEMPLPPYIKYEKEKEERYQTYFAKELGSAAAPTASLHFSPQLIAGLEERGVDFERVCLHVGLGTFKPVWEENITNQKLHFEPMIINMRIRSRIMNAKLAGKKLLPVGTTMVRYLESLPYIWHFLQKEKSLISSLDPAVVARRDNLTQDLDISRVQEFIPDQKIDFLDSGEILIQTRLFLRPGVKFLLVDELISNFHLPKSSLLMLISAFMGRENALQAYEFAIQNDFKFYSFGDGMWIKPCN
ncbi:S-adenosylmethionine:tRNA ribosyltransferase-isomerase [Candidatus Gracilibacteria bacterium]|nr:S-adenosylmethionine:tRNA ribosyltransferase-isomerase [Candidatus Gracilibacteria bacterium]